MDFILFILSIVAFAVLALGYLFWDEHQGSVVADIANTVSIWKQKLTS